MLPRFLNQVLETCKQESGRDVYPRPPNLTSAFTKNVKIVFWKPKIQPGWSCTVSQGTKCTNMMSSMNSEDKHHDTVSHTSSCFCLGVQWGWSMHSADAVGATGRRQGDIGLSCASRCPGHASREWSKPHFLQTEAAVLCCALPWLHARATPTPFKNA